MEQGLLELVGELIEARVQFFTRNLNGITFLQRRSALQHFLSIEERYIDLIDRLHRSNLRNQLVTSVITLTMGEAAGTMENVRVAPSQEQVDSAIMDIASSENNCAICQDSISSAGVRIRHCRHDFHRSCLNSWFSMSVRCPVCRHDIRETQTGPAAQTSSVATGTTSLSVNPSAGR